MRGEAAGREQPATSTHTKQSNAGALCTHQHIHIEDPAVLPRTNAQRLQVQAALVKYPVQGVGDLGAKVITSSTFKLRSGIG